MDNLEEKDKFLEKYKFPKLNQEEIKNLNRPITSTEIETVIRNIPANKSPVPSPGDLSDPGIEPGSPTLQVDSLTSEPPGRPCIGGGHVQYKNA